MNSINLNLEEGKSYYWYIKIDEIERSQTYTLFVADKNITKEIYSQLLEIDKIRGDKSSSIAKALYLQVLSDQSMDIDLYAASLRLIVDDEKLGNENEEYKNYLFELIALH